MGSLRTSLAACLLVLPALAGSASVGEDLRRTFAGCAGRLSAQMEHQWLMGDAAADRTESQRRSMLDMLEALGPAPGEAALMAHRIEVKHLHARLLRRGTFSDDADDARWARLRAESELGACLGLMLG